MSELMDIVNESGKLIGQATRDEIHNIGAWHRGVHVLIFNKCGEMLLQKRSQNKDKFPGCYDISLSEHLQRGETYKKAALRGLKEELGVTSIPIKKLFRFKLVYGLNDNNISEIYEGKYDGQLKIDRTEINKIEFMPMDKIKKILQKDDDVFASWAKEILKYILNMPSKVEALAIDEGFD